MDLISHIYNCFTSKRGMGSTIGTLWLQSKAINAISYEHSIILLPPKLGTTNQLTTLIPSAAHLEAAMNCPWWQTNCNFFKLVFFAALHVISFPLEAIPQFIISFTSNQFLIEKDHLSNIDQIKTYWHYPTVIYSSTLSKKADFGGPVVRWRGGWVVRDLAGIPFET